VVPSGQILHLSDFAMARREDGRIALEAPGAWARVVVHDPSLLAVLGALASGCVLDACCRAVPEHSANAVGKLLQLFDWCNLLAHSENAGVFAPHERLMHTRTRLGYHRKPIGKTGQNPVQAETSQPSLEMVALPRLGNEEMPLDTVLRMRRSIRTHGAAPMRKEQLSRFLLRVLAEENGRRSYPSGGGCYPLNGYLAIRLCQDVSAGLYRYLPEKHMLSKVAEDGPGLNQLMKDTAVAAATTEPPQMLLILSADFTRITPAYGDLSYSLVLKEAGAIMQSAALAAAAGGLAACPLGTGNSLLFSRLAGLDPTRETSVAEVMLGAQSQV
jgi:SagB-type dehydrogenase family enzyme